MSEEVKETKEVKEEEAKKDAVKKTENVVSNDLYVKFGGKDLAISATIGKTTSEAANKLLAEGKSAEDIQLDVFDILGNLKEEHLLDLVALVIYNNENFDVETESFAKAREFVSKHFRASKAMRIIRVWFDKEDIGGLFLEVRKIMAAFQQNM